MYKKILQRILQIIVTLFIGALLYPFITDFYAREDDVDDNRRKVEILGASVTGYRDKQLSWKVMADYIWAGRSRYLYRAEGVTSGYFYDSKGRLIIDQVKAGKIRMNTKTKTFSASEGVQVRFINRKKVVTEEGLYAEEEKVDDDPVKITSNELRYFGDSDRVFLYNNVKIEQDDVMIYPESGVEVNNEENVAYIDNGFYMESEDFTVSGNQMTIYIDDDRSEMTGGLIFTRQDKELKKGLDLLAKGKAVDYEGATGVTFTDVGEAFGSFLEKEVKGGKFKTKKQR